MFSDEKEAAVEADEEGAGSALIGTNFVAKLKFLMKVVAKGQSIFRTTSNVKEELKTKLSLRMALLQGTMAQITLCITRILSPTVSRH